MDSIQQIAHGSIGSKEGVWFLTITRLLFAENLGSDPAKVTFTNVTDSLRLAVSEGSRVAPGPGGEVYLVTPTDVTLLNCSQNQE